jgi:hypothetical protein
MLSERQQVTRIRQLAGRALGAYPLADPQLRLIAHQENTTFRSMPRSAAVVIVFCSACTARRVMAGRSTRWPRSARNWTG